MSVLSLNPPVLGKASVFGYRRTTPEDFRSSGASQFVGARPTDALRALWRQDVCGGMHVCMHEGPLVCMGGWMDGCMDAGWMDCVWMEGWMNG